MTLDEVEARLRKRFLHRKCRVRFALGGSETAYAEGKPKVRIIAGQEFKKVVDIEVGGQPSAWNWYARFLFEDDTISASFTRMRDIEVLGG